MFGGTHFIFYLDPLFRYFTKCKLALNPQKCQAIVFNCYLKLSKMVVHKIRNTSLYLSNSPIPNQTKTICLGVTMNSKVISVHHKNYALQRVNNAFSSLRSVMLYQKLYKMRRLLRFHTLLWLWGDYGIEEDAFSATFTASLEMKIIPSMSKISRFPRQPN